MTVRFSIISGKPTDEELAVLTQVLSQHKRVEKVPVLSRSNWAQPILRSGLPLTQKSNQFWAGRNI